MKSKRKIQIDSKAYVDDEKEDLYPKKVLETIRDLDDAYQWKDICVLVRKNSQGVRIASYLNSHGVDIISSVSINLPKAISSTIFCFISGFMLFNMGVLT